MYGYKIYPYLNVAPLFATYEKKLDKASSINYEDHFNNPNTFTWFSRNKLNVDSSEIKALLNVLNNNGHVLLFIKKEDIKNSKNTKILSILLENAFLNLMKMLRCKTKLVL